MNQGHDLQGIILYNCPYLYTFNTLNFLVCSCAEVGIRYVNKTCALDFKKVHYINAELGQAQIEYNTIF